MLRAVIAPERRNQNTCTTPHNAMKHETESWIAKLPSWIAEAQPSEAGNAEPKQT
jgi:hypothetical protein